MGAEREEEEEEGEEGETGVGKAAEESTETEEDEEEGEEDVDEERSLGEMEEVDMAGDAFDWGFSAKLIPESATGERVGTDNGT